MNDFFVFLLSHWVLSGLFLLTLILLVLFELQQRAAGASSLSSQELVDWVNHHKARIIDIRDETAFGTGHIAGASSWGAEGHEARIAKLKNKSHPIVVVCQNGQSAHKVSTQLRQAGFEQVAVLQGGMQAWINEHLPTVQK